jgi:hypothetical protein
MGGPVRFLSLLVLSLFVFMVAMNQVILHQYLTFTPIFKEHRIVLHYELPGSPSKMTGFVESSWVDSTTEKDEAPVCEHCSDNQTCASLFEKHPNLIVDCVKNPTLSQCQMVCADYPEPANKKATQEKEDSCKGHSKLWPALDEGQWIEDTEYCTPFQGTPRECLLGKYRWKLSGCSQFETFDREQACSLLWEHNISDIAVVGDSLMRHIWQGLVLVLSGDFDYNIHGDTQGCRGESAFSEKKCRASVGAMVPLCFQNSTNMFVHVHLTNTLRPFPNRGKTLQLYGIGNHRPYPSDGQHDDLIARLGILNSSAFKAYRWNGFVKPYSGGEDGRHLIWIPPHYKLSIGRFDESNQRALEFLQESHDFFTQGNHTGTLNTYSLTKGAVPFFCRSCKAWDSTGSLYPPCEYFVRDTCERTLETWDGFHFGRGLNTWKAHLALSHFQNTVEARQADAHP